MFNRIPDAKVLIRKKGNYQELDLYELDTEVYAKYGSSYIKIFYGNITSNASYRWIKIENLNVQYKNSVLIYEQIQDKA